MSKFIELLLLSYAGILLHYTLKLKEAADKDQLTDLFTRKSIIRDIIAGFVSILCATLIIYVRDDISTIFVVTPASAIMAGYSGQSLFNKAIGAKAPQLKPKDDAR